MKPCTNLFSAKNLGSYACPTPWPALAGYPSAAPIRLCSGCCRKPVAVAPQGRSAPARQHPLAFAGISASAGLRGKIEGRG